MRWNGSKCCFYNIFNKVLDLTGNVEDLFESVISAWEVVIVFVLPFEINVAGNVFGATVVFVSLWSGVTVSKAAVFSFLNSSVIENVSGFVAIVSFFTVATSKFIVLISFFDVGEITNCCATVKVSLVKVASCFAVKLVLFGILFLSDVLSDKAWTIVVKIVSKSLLNDCEMEVILFLISSLFEVIDDVSGSQDVIFSIIFVATKTEVVDWSFFIPSGFKVVDGITGDTVIVLVSEVAVIGYTGDVMNSLL